MTDAKGVAQIEVDHPEIGLAQLLLMVAIGTVDSDFFDGLISQLANVGTRGRGADERGLNFMLAMVKGVEPKDQVEAMYRL